MVYKNAISWNFQVKWWVSRFLWVLFPWFSGNLKEETLFPGLQVLCLCILHFPKVSFCGNALLLTCKSELWVLLQWDLKYRCTYVWILTCSWLQYLSLKLTHCKHRCLPSLLTLLLIEVATILILRDFVALNKGISWVFYTLCYWEGMSSTGCFLLGNVYTLKSEFPLCVLKKHKNFTLGLWKWYLAAQLLEFFINASKRY